MISFIVPKKNAKDRSKELDGEHIFHQNRQSQSVNADIYEDETNGYPDWTSR